MNASGVDDPLAGLPDLATLARYDAALRQVPTDVETIQAAIGAARERLERADAAGDRQDALAAVKTRVW